MRKLLSVFVCAVMLLGIMATPLSVIAADLTPVDVPKILIYTTDGATPNRDAYVTCSITIVDEAGGTYETIVDDASSIKIRGNSTAMGEKAPYNIKFSAKTDVLGMGKAKKWALLSNCYEKTLLRNKTVLDFSEHTNLEYTSQSKFVDLYLNDTFLGSYQITESVEVGSSRVDIDTSINEFLVERDFRTDDELYRFTTSRYGIAFNINEPEVADITTDQSAFITDFFDKAETALASGDLTAISQYFDIPTMVDFYIVNEFFKTTDVHQSSTRVYIQDGLIHGGPLWDFDLASGNINPNFNNWYCNYGTAGNGSGNSWEGIYAGAYYGFGIWFYMLMQCPEFEQMVIDRYAELAPYFENLYKDNDLGTNYIDKMLAEYGDHFARNYDEAGWKIDYAYSIAVDLTNPYERIPDSTYEENVEYYRYWLEQRHLWLLENWGLSDSTGGDSGDTGDTGGDTTTDTNPPEGTVNLLSGLEIKEYVADTYPDYYTDMTDGNISDTFNITADTVAQYKNDWFGFNANQVDSLGYGYVIYDLGEECNISYARFHLGVASGTGTGISHPYDPIICFSNDGVNFTSYQIPYDRTTAPNGAYWWSVGGLNVTARYVKFALIPSHWAFVDEIEVYGTPVAEEYVLGDADNNGVLGVADYLMLKRLILGAITESDLPSPETAALRCDVNMDESYTVVDYLMLRRAILGEITLG